MLCQSRKQPVILTVLFVLFLLSLNVHSEPLESDSVTFALGHLTAKPGDTIFIPFEINTPHNVTGYSILFSIGYGTLDPLYFDPTGTRGDGVPVFLSALGSSTLNEIAGVLAYDTLYIPAGTGPVNNIVVLADESVRRGSLIPLSFYDEPGEYGRKNEITYQGTVYYFPDFQNGSVLFGIEPDISELGDVNLNSLPNEIADYVTIGNQLVHGYFKNDPHFELRNINADVDMDLLPWTVSDMLTMSGYFYSHLVPPIEFELHEIIHNPGDSIWFENYSQTEPAILEVPIYMANENDAGAVSFSMDFSSKELEFLGVDMDDSRIPSGWNDIYANDWGKGMTFAILPSPQYDQDPLLAERLTAGSGLITTLRFAMLSTSTDTLELEFTLLQNGGRTNGYAVWENDRWNFASLQNKYAWIDIDLSYVIGDADGSGWMDIDDVVYLIQYVYQGGPEPSPVSRGDFNGDLAVDENDIMDLLMCIFH